MKPQLRGVVVLLFSIAGLAMTGCQKDRLMMDPDADPDAQPKTFDQGSRQVFSGIGDFFSGVGKATGSAFKEEKPVLNATRVEVDRQTSPFVKQGDKPVEPALSQHLSIDLRSGSVVMADIDGQKYPNRLDFEDTARLKKLLDTGTWRGAASGGGAAKAVAGDRYYYRMTVYQSEQALPEVVMWSATSSDKLREELSLVTDVFSRQHRRAHPLSDRFDLVGKSDE